MEMTFRQFADRALDHLAMGVILSTLFCLGFLLLDGAGLEASPLSSNDPMAIRAAFWALLALVFAPAVAGTAILFAADRTGD